MKNKRYLREIDERLSLILLRAMIKMMLADGVIEDNEKLIISDIFSTITNNSLSPDELDEEIKGVQKRANSIQVYLINLSEELHQTGKEAVITALFLVAASNGNIAPEQLDFLNEVQSILQLENDYIEELIKTSEAKS